RAAISALSAASLLSPARLPNNFFNMMVRLQGCHGRATALSRLSWRSVAPPDQARHATSLTITAIRVKPLRRIVGTQAAAVDLGRPGPFEACPRQLVNIGHVFPRCTAWGKRRGIFRLFAAKS